MDWLQDWITFFRLIFYWIRFYMSGLVNFGWYFFVDWSESLLDCWLVEGGCNSNLLRMEFSLSLVDWTDYA